MTSTLDSTRRLSIGFRCMLAGLAVTIAGYFGPWEWPAWPAFAVIDLVFGPGGSWVELSSGARELALVGLIAVNTVTWAIVAWAIFAIMRALHVRIRQRRHA